MTHRIYCFDRKYSDPNYKPSVMVESRHIIAPGFVNDALDVLESRGINARQLLASAGIRLGEPVSDIAFGEFWRLSAQRMRCEMFGLAGRPMRPGSFALMSQAALHAGSLEQALKRILAFLNIVLDGPIAQLRIKGDEATITLTETGPARSAFTYRTYWLIVVGLACWLVGRRIPFRAISFAIPAPPGRAEYHRFFGAKVIFGGRQHRLSLDAKWTKLPIRRSEAALKIFLRNAPGNILLRFRDEQGVVARVRERLKALPANEWPSFDELAQGMRTSPATLRRRLRKEGQNFAAIRDELRSIRAQSLLKSKRTIAEIAAELGYSEAGAFHRAFVGWAGQSPGRWRERYSD